METEDVKKIAVIGSGAMGHGISEVAAIAGIDVTMKDIKQEYLDNALFQIKKDLIFKVRKGKISEKTADRVIEEHLKTTLDTGEAVEGAQLIIEAVPEILELKKTVFREISSLTVKGTILATNTSAMSISEIGSVVQNPGRFAGLHFFNPVNRMGLVEIIYGDRTTDKTVDLLVSFAKRIKKEPVIVFRDSPGFIVNRINAPNQALMNALLDEGLESPCEIDAGVREMGMPMGPFELIDFVGIDVFCHTLDYYSKTLSKDYTPGKFILKKVNNNELGMKTGKGIYHWSSGRPDIDVSRKSETFTPMMLLSVQLNESVKVYKEGITTSTDDIDNAMVCGMNAFMGPYALCSDQSPALLSDTLHYLYERFGMEIFKPEPEVADGSYKHFRR